MKLVADGGAGDDALSGTNGADLLSGGDGRDFVDGQHGADVALLGAGDDTLSWSASDGSDIVEGGAGADALRMNAAAPARPSRRPPPPCACVSAGRTPMGPKWSTLAASSS